MKEFTFPIYCYYGKGDSGESAIDVELTDEEAERLIKYGTQAEIYDNGFDECEELKDIYEKIYPLAVEQITLEICDADDECEHDPNWRADENYPCGVSFPEEFEDMLTEEEE
jgi:hypothetical protein